MATSDKSRRVITALTAAVIPAIGVMILTAPVAYAQTEQQIQAGCNEARAPTAPLKVAFVTRCAATAIGRADRTAIRM
jgi:hypothetical protein